MMAIAFLASLGIGLTAFAIDEFKSDDNDVALEDEDGIQKPDVGPDLTNEPDELDQEEEPRVVDGTFFGTAGYDTLTPETVTDLPDRTGIFEKRGGDDSVTYGFGVGITPNGSEGDDTLSIQNGENLIDGGPGDDVLSAGLGSTIMGGDGDDDVICYDQQDDQVDGWGEVQGGNFDNTISLTTDIGPILAVNAPVAMSSNAGAYTFEVTINQMDNKNFSDPWDLGEDSSLITIEDFNPGENILTLDITPLIETSGRDLTGTEFTELADGGWRMADISWA